MYYVYGENNTDGWIEIINMDKKDNYQYWIELRNADEVSDDLEYLEKRLYKEHYLNNYISEDDNYVVSNTLRNVVSNLLEDITDLHHAIDINKPTKCQNSDVIRSLKGLKEYISSQLKKKGN